MTATDCALGEMSHEWGPKCAPMHNSVAGLRLRHLPLYIPMCIPAWLAIAIGWGFVWLAAMGHSYLLLWAAQMDKGDTSVFRPVLPLDQGCHLLASVLLGWATPRRVPQIRNAE